MPKGISSRNKRLPIISIIGVDGSGKSTILASLIKNFKHDLVRNIYTLERPSRKPAPGKAIRNYAKPPRFALVSIAKILLSALSWSFKYHFTLSPMRRTGTLILCDHFYFLGIMLDPLKYRYGGPSFLPRLVLRVIPQPDIYIFLDVPLDIVYERKQEITWDEMSQLITRHREYMAGIPNGILIDAREPVEQVTAECSQKIIQVIEGA